MPGRISERCGFPSNSRDGRDECVDAGIALREIRVDPVIVHELTGSKSECEVVHRDVPISADTECLSRVDNYSEPASNSLDVVPD